VKFAKLTPICQEGKREGGEDTTGGTITIAEAQRSTVKIGKLAQTTEKIETSQHSDSEGTALIVWQRECLKFKFLEGQLEEGTG
jgi:hypothetical protein